MTAHVAENRKARHDFHILETFEAGIALQGTEVKSCREHNVSLQEAYARVVDNELWLIGAHIAEYSHGNRNNHVPTRTRKLLMHKKEILRLARAVEAQGQTLVPLRMYLSQGRIKVEVALCRGKQLHDKRETLKRKMHQRDTERAIAQFRR